jgi:hypothetical protein
VQAKIRVHLCIALLMLVFAAGAFIIVSAKDEPVLPDCLQTLLKAKTWNDGVRGEGPEISKNFLAYSDAVAILSKLRTEDLEYVLKSGTPAGRIYAAMLLKQSGRDNQSFQKLLADKSTVDYVSGCKAMSAAVQDIARSFIDKGCYLNFSLTVFCTLQPPPKSATEVQAICLVSLMSQNGVQHYEQGDSNQPSDGWRAFHLLLKQGSQAKRASLTLLDSPHPGARIYGAVLLSQFDASEANPKIKQLLNDKATLQYKRGCEVETTSVGALAGRLLKGEELILLKDPRVKE